MKLISYAMILLLMPSISSAQATEPEHLPIRIEAGERAPFTGTLVTIDHAIRIAQKASHCAERTAAEVARATQLLDVDLGVAKYKLRNQKELARKREELLRRHVDGSEKWYRQPVFVAAASVALTVAAILTARKTVIGVRGD